MQNSYMSTSIQNFALLKLSIMIWVFASFREWLNEVSFTPKVVITFSKKIVKVNLLMPSALLHFYQYFEIVRKHPQNGIISQKKILWFGLKFFITLQKFLKTFEETCYIKGFVQKKFGTIWSTIEEFKRKKSTPPLKKLFKGGP